jgi:hypothetical protein
MKLFLALLAAGFASAQTCDASLWKHIYNPQRLVLIEKCVTVTGIIVRSKAEADGDRHIQLHLDPQFRSMLNARNLSAQDGNLVLEPICVDRVKQADAVSACHGFKNTVIVPKPGTRVRVTGSFIRDSEANHGWQEIHPVTSITTLP